jgi:hypothetical protein
MAITQQTPHGVNPGSVEFPLWVDAVFLGAGTEETYTVPANAGFALFTCTLPVWGCLSGPAVIPATEITDGTGSFYISAGIQCKIGSGDSISFIRATAANTIVSIGVYRQ